MTSKQPKVQGARRAFFRNVAAMGAAAATGTLLMRAASTAQADSGQVPEDTGQAYRETNHIRKYYDTARG